MSEATHPDWGPGGESRGVAVVPATPAYRTAEEVPPGTALTGYEVAALATKDVSGEPAGLPGELIREMQRTAEGFDAHHAMLSEAANRVLSEVRDPASFAQSFDTLPESVRAKALRVLWHNPSISLLDLIDKTEPLLTLSEAHACGTWIRKHAGALR